MHVLLTEVALPPSSDLSVSLLDLSVLFRVVVVEISIDVYGNGTGNLDIRATDAARSLKIEIGRLMSRDTIRDCGEASI